MLEYYGEGRTLTSAQIANCILVIATLRGESAKAIESKRSGCCSEYKLALRHLPYSAAGESSGARKF